MENQFGFTLETDTHDLFNMQLPVLRAYALWATEQISDASVPPVKKNKLRQRRLTAETNIASIQSKEKKT